MVTIDKQYLSAAAIFSLQFLSAATAWQNRCNLNANNQGQWEQDDLAEAISTFARSVLGDYTAQMLSNSFDKSFEQFQCSDLQRIKIQHQELAYYHIVGNLVSVRG